MQSSPLILLVEDEPLIAMELQAALEDNGFGVHPVESGTEALTIIESGAVEYAGLVTDVQLGGNIEGWDVAQKAREVNPHIPVVYMSGDSAADHPSRGVPQSVMLQKPFASIQMIIAISELLNAVPPRTDT